MTRITLSSLLFVLLLGSAPTSSAYFRDPVDFQKTTTSASLSRIGVTTSYEWPNWIGAPAWILTMPDAKVLTGPYMDGMVKMEHSLPPSLVTTGGPGIQVEWPNWIGFPQWWAN